MSPKLPEVSAVGRSEDQSVVVAVEVFPERDTERLVILVIGTPDREWAPALRSRSVAVAINMRTGAARIVDETEADRSIEGWGQR
jgi:hypothetical protein